MARHIVLPDGDQVKKDFRFTVPAAFLKLGEPNLKVDVGRNAAIVRGLKASMGIATPVDVEEECESLYSGSRETEGARDDR